MSSQLKPGLLLRDLRKQRGLTLEQVANEIDITPLALSNIERKGAKPQRGNLIALLDELKSVRKRSGLSRFKRWRLLHTLLMSSKLS